MVTILMVLAVIAGIMIVLLLGLLGALLLFKVIHEVHELGKKSATYNNYRVPTACEPESAQDILAYHEAMNGRLTLDDDDEF